MRYYFTEVLVIVPDNITAECSEESDLTLAIAKAVNHDHLSDERNVSLIGYVEITKDLFDEYVYDIFDEFGGI